METSPKHLQNPSLNLSPTSPSTTCSSSSSNGGVLQVQAPHPAAAAAAAAFSQVQLQSPKPIPRSETGNPYPTTFVQADTSSFKQVVQMLTGSSETAKHVSSNPTSDPPSRTHIPPIKSTPKKQQSGFKLFERRNSLKNLKISPLIPVFASSNSGYPPRNPEILSPSILDFPSLVLSPVTPLILDPFDRSGLVNFSSLKNVNANLESDAEEKAIKEKGFFFHPSPVTTPRDTEPRLLPLFPTTSPRVPGSSTTS